MKAVVLGATGHLGNAILRELLANGWEVTATGRQAQPPAHLRELGIDYRRGDADREGQLEAWVRGHDLVVDAAAPYPLHLFSSSGDPRVRARRRIGALLKAVERQGCALGYVSSFTTLGRPGRADSLAARAARALHPYFEVKQLMEDQVLEAARRGLPAVVLNPTMCLGPWDAKPRHLCLVPRLLAGEVISSVDHVVNVIDVRDVARVLVAALDGGRFGEPILASGFNISVEDLCREICALGNARPPTVRTPTQVALAVAYWSEYWLAMVGQKASYPSLSMLLLTQFTALPPNPTLAELGVSLRPLAATIGDSITWFRSLGYC